MATLTELGSAAPLDFAYYCLQAAQNDLFAPYPFFDDVPMTADSSAAHDYGCNPILGVAFASPSHAADQPRAIRSPQRRMLSASPNAGSTAVPVDSSPASLAGGGHPRTVGMQGHVASGQRAVLRRLEAGPGTVLCGSVSPDSNLIYTPTSTQQGDASATEDQSGDFTLYEDEYNPAGISPASTHTAEEFVIVPSVVTGASSTVGMNNRQPPPSTVDSGASRASSVASHIPATTTNFSGQWGSVTATTGSWMDPNSGNVPSDEFGNLSASHAFPSTTYPTADQFNQEFLSHAGSFENVVAASNFNAHLPFRGVDDYSYMIGSSRMLSQFPQQHHPHAQLHPHPHQQHAPFQHQQPQLHPQYIAAAQQAARMRSVQNIQPPPINTSVQQAQPILQSAPPDMPQQRPTASHSQHMPGTARQVGPNDSASRSASYQQQSLRPPAQQPGWQPQIKKESSPSSSQSSSTAGPSSRSLQPVVKTEGQNAAQQQAGRKGGRQKHSHLPEQKRQQSHKMRKKAACWRCALQRDPCDENDPCSRCLTRLQKGQVYFFDCDRSKLPDFVHDFLPPSMTLMYQKQTIEDTVRDQVLDWDRQNPIDVYLTSGYGPALRWKLYEFKPRSPELLGQLQYLQDPNTGTSQRSYKYSPPFGLMKLAEGDDSYFEDYLTQLMDWQFLEDFGWTCFEEETQIDPDAFQAGLLHLLCKLYGETRDYDLQNLLRDIIRMMIITYIMSHTLTISEDTVSSVISSIKFSNRPAHPMRHTSPRLANRQLKFFFSILRNNIYENILKWQQQTLHTSGKKEDTWLSSFCAMLGFAMVLEEVQRTLQIQADAKAAKEEMGVDAANTEAFNACERIDARFKLLVGLFQCKYRDKKWGVNGSFGNHTPRLSGAAENSFLKAVRESLEEKAQHLENRRDVECSPQNQCLYTSRLVARFLLPFLKL